MQVKDIMSHPVVTCPASSMLDQAARLMWEFDCGIIPIVKDDGRLAGIITDRDICMAAYMQGKPLNVIPVTTAMAKELVASHAEESIEHAENLMRENKVRRLPILDSENRIVGILSLNDLARAATRGKRSQTDRELVQTLAAICEPRPKAAVRPEPIPVKPSVFR